MMLVVGDLLLDVLLLSELKLSEQPAGMIARSGGSAANTAAWMQHLGCPVTFVGCVGDDGIGDMLRRELRDGGVETRVRTVDGLETGCVAVELDAHGERLMRSSRGANVALVAADVRGVVHENVWGVHLTGYALLGVGGFGLLHAAAEVARAHGAILSFDPSSEGAIAALGRDRLLRELSECGVDLLLPNVIEATALTGRVDATEAAVVLGETIPTVVVKCSERGAVAFASGELHSVPTQPIDPLDTTGAGDAFNAGMLVALRRGAGIEECCRQGHAVAREVITWYGGRPARRRQPPASAGTN
jgi:sugar/nucleoside kinase (ribokinase family)